MAILNGVDLEQPPKWWSFEDRWPYVSGWCAPANRAELIEAVTGFSGAIEGIGNARGSLLGVSFSGPAIPLTGIPAGGPGAGTSTAIPSDFAYRLVSGANLYAARYVSIRWGLLADGEDRFAFSFYQTLVWCYAPSPWRLTGDWTTDPTLVYQLTWDYESGTTLDTTGVWTWADNVGASGLYNAGWSGAAFGYNGSTYDELAGANHLPVTEGQLVTLSLLGNGRTVTPGPSSNDYVISWYTDTTAVTAFASATLLTTGAGNQWLTYSETAVAPAGAGGFSIRMPRQCGQDDVVLTVAEF